MGMFGRFREKACAHLLVTFEVLDDCLTYCNLQVSEVGHPGHFKATSNERVNLMYKEASEFARRLEKCSRQIKAVEAATAGTFW